jgi:DNA-binding GntR family transcriptional regulator
MGKVAERRLRSFSGSSNTPRDVTRGDEIRLQLEQDILAGRLLPGDHLNEGALGERFSSSRTPIREAIRQLAAQGLVEVVPRKGAFVAEISLGKLLEVFELMREIEGLCARLAAERITPEQTADLIELHKACEALTHDEKDAQKYFEVSSGFHRIIFAATQNSAIEELANATYDRLLAYRRYQLDTVKRPQASFAEHGKVLQAILERDGPRAERAMRAHADRVTENAADLLPRARR